MSLLATHLVALGAEDLRHILIFFLKWPESRQMQKKTNPNLSILALFHFSREDLVLPFNAFITVLHGKLPPCWQQVVLMEFGKRYDTTDAKGLCPRQLFTARQHSLLCRALYYL